MSDHPAAHIDKHAASDAAPDAHEAGALERRLFVRGKLLLAAALIACGQIAVFAIAHFQARNGVLPMGTPVGGDFIAFWSAARALALGEAHELYRPEFFDALLRQFGPPLDHFGLTWQYPPSMFLLIRPLGALPFGAAYAAWCAAGLVLFYIVLRRLTQSVDAGLFAALSPPVFAAFVTGQNILFTAPLLFAASMLARRKPELAGLCAGLLTIKPQLGVLIPIAFIAGGHWRAFRWAIYGAASLALTSLLFYGDEPWRAWLGSLAGVSGGMESGAYPLFKMPTVFASAGLIGAPAPLAWTLQALSLALSAYLVAHVWRRARSDDLKAAVLCAATFFATPYAYYYEFALLCLPVAVVAVRGVREGWLPAERVVLAALFIAPLLLPGPPRQWGLQPALLVPLAALALAYRRARVEAGPAFPPLPALKRN